MLYTEKSNFTETPANAMLLPDSITYSPLEELIATGEAVFAIIRHSEIELEMKNAFYQLEKQFDFYKNLLVK